MKRSFIYTDDKSSKFWTIQIIGNSYTVRFGKTGTTGQIQAKEFEDEAACRKAVEKLIVEKAKKGYFESELPESSALVIADTSASKSGLVKEKPAKKKIVTSDLEINLAPLADDGKPKAWHEDKKVWGYHAPDYEYLTPEILADDSDDYLYKSTENTISEECLDETELKLNALRAKYKESDAMSLFTKACNDADIENLEFLWNILVSKKMYNLDVILKSSFSAILKYENYKDGQHQTIEWLLKKGLKYEYESHSKMQQFFEKEYWKDPRPERVAEIIEASGDHAFAPVKDQIIDSICTFINALREGKKEDDPNSKIPEGGYGEDCWGISFWGGYNNISFRVMGNTSNFLFKFTERDIDDIVKPFGTHFMKKHLVPILEEMIDQGKFDGLFPSGLFVLLNEDTKELAFRHSFDDKAAERFEKQVQEFENGEWKSSSGLRFIFKRLTDGLLFGADPDRAYRIVRRYLYSGEEIPEEDAYELLKKLGEEEKDSRALYELALWKNANVLLGDARRFIQLAVEAGYAPALELEKKMDKEQSVRKILFPTIERKNAAHCTTYNLNAAMRQWAATFEAAFTEEDLYIETENIIARARKDGNIYIRFRIEGEEGYSEALDFINNLLENGYAKLSKGWTDGFALNVYFVRKPDFIPQLKNAKFGASRYSYPRTAAHAFFARAVQYPALRPKVAKYAERALIDYNWYLDLDSEGNTIPGTFAVNALAFCEAEYFYLVEKFANAIDADHTYLQNAFSRALVKHYGRDISSAKMLYELAKTVGQSEELPFNSVKDLIWSAPFFEVVLEIVEERTTDDLFWFRISARGLYGDNAKRVLAKIKLMWTEAKDEREKEIIAKFHDFYLLVIEQEYDDEYNASMKPINANTAEKKTEKSINAEEITGLDHQSIVITLKEAEKQNLDVDGDYDSKIMFFISPSCITNLEDLAYTKKQWLDIGIENSQMSENRRCQIRLGHTLGNVSFGKWVVLCPNMEYEYAMILF